MSKIAVRKTMPFWLLVSLALYVFFIFIAVISFQKKHSQNAHAQTKAAAAIDLCSAEGDGILNQGDVPSYAGDDVTISGCTFTITGTHSFASLTIGDGIGSGDSVLVHAQTDTTTVYNLNITTTGNITVNSDGEINAVGRGFLGAQSGGNAGQVGMIDNGAGTPTATGGSADRVGGTHAGRGGSYSVGAPTEYGSLTNPVTAGGGGGSAGGSNIGGDGGGIIILNAGGTFTNNGLVSANGATPPGTQAAASGAGGSVNITATTFAGTNPSAIISANGGLGATDGGAGGGGRIAITYDSTTYSGSITAYGGDGTADAFDRNGGVGTIYLHNTANTYGDLVLDNNDLIIYSPPTAIDTSPNQFNSVAAGNYAYFYFPNNVTVDTSFTVDDNSQVSAPTNAYSLTVGSITLTNSSIMYANTINASGNITISSSSSLRHPQTTTSNVYRLDVTASTLTIDTGATINLQGRGFEEDYTTDGAGGTQFFDNRYYGGSHGGLGGGVSDGNPRMSAFGSITQPVDPGGGGGTSGVNDAGEGGGYLKVTVDNFVLNGIINANGDDGTGNGSGGAGGGVWITVNNSVSGTGSITANGGDHTSGTFGRGGGAGGRIAFYHTNSAPDSLTMETFGGTHNSVTTDDGGAGTIYIQDNALVPGTYADGQGVLIIDNGQSNYNDSVETTPLNQTFYNVTVRDGVYLTSTGTLTVNNNYILDNYAIHLADGITVGGDFTVTNNAQITHRETTTSTVYRLNINVTGDFSLDATSSIPLDAKGFPADYTSNGAGGVVNDTTTTGDTWGGSHGGTGGPNGGVQSASYDLLRAPADPGAGGGSNCSGGCDGGGYLSLQATDITINGTISANGSTPATAGGGGAGGGIYLQSTGTFTGAGTIRANGGTGTTNFRGAGAGGRIALIWDSTSATGFDDNTDLRGTLTVQAFGSTGTGDPTFFNSAGGTVYLEDTNTQTANQGDLLIDNNNVDAAYRTLLFVPFPTDPTSYTFNNLFVINQADLWVNDECTGGVALTVTGAIDLSNGGTITVANAADCGVTAATLDLPTSLNGGVSGIAYSESIAAPGGYAPKTYSLDAGSLPTGLSLNTSTGVISGTPTTPGVYSFTIGVTDSNPAGADTDSQAYNVTIGNPPNSPVLVAPLDGATTNLLAPDLEATYSDPDSGDTGTVEFRVSSGSTTDCINNVNVVASGSSASSTTNNEDLTWTVTPDLVDLTTYSWCARNNDGIATSDSGAYLAMGEFTVDESYSPGGASPQKQQAIENQNTQPPTQETTPPAETEEPTSTEDPTDTEEPVDEEPIEEETEPLVEEDTNPLPEEEPSQPEQQNPDQESLPEEEQQEAPGDNQPPPPQPRPTPEETQNVDRIIDGVINEEAQTTGPGNQQSQTPSEARIVTNSQSDGRSFTIEVQDTGDGSVDGDERRLSINGLATTDQDRIEFTGTTNEPFTTITLFFNGGVSVVVTSDEQGFWQTFVNAAQLGIDVGERSTFDVDAIATKEGLQSSKVSIGRFALDLRTNESTQEQEVVAEFQSVFSENVLISDIRSLLQKTDQLVKENEDSIQQTLTVSAPIIVVASAPLWGYLPYLPTMVYHFITYLVGLLARKKQEDEKGFGFVYDAITKKPLSLVVLRIYQIGSNESHLLSTKVTNKTGRFDLLLEPGSYRVEAKKPGYTFPSTIDSFTSEFTVQPNDPLSLRVPLDPVNAKRAMLSANIFKKLLLTLQKASQHIVLPVLFIGAFVSAVTLFSVPQSAENWILTALYVFLFLLQLRLRPVIEKAWGVVYDLATNAVLPLTTIQLVDPEYGKVVASRLTDYEGRFAFMPEPGSYVVKANKEGYQQAEVVESGDKQHEPITGEVQIKKEGEKIKGDIPMRTL